MTNNASPTNNGWSIRRDDSESDLLDFRYNNKTAFSVDSAGVICSAGHISPVHLRNSSVVEPFYKLYSTEPSGFYRAAINSIGVSINGSASTIWTQSGNFIPAVDAAKNLGSGDKQWANIYASTSTINTSDKRHKQDITAIPNNVISAWRDINFCQYRWIDAIAEKIKEVFDQHGLDAQDYGLLCYDQWAEQPEERDEEGNITQAYRAAGDAWGVRIEECLVLEAESQRQKSADL